MKLEHIDFQIPECNNIGISLSAGIDTIILTCMIIEELKRTGRNTPITAMTVIKSTAEPEYAERIVGILEEKYNVKINHKNNIPNEPEYEANGTMTPRAITDLYEEFNEDIEIYLGVNNPNEYHGNLGFEYKEGIFPCHMPFVHLSKWQILETAYELGMEDLLPYAHSCARLPYDDCGKCYSCEERQWGFDKINKPNPKFIPL